MKKFRLFIGLVILVMSLIACSGGGALIGKWSIDKDLIGLAANEEMTIEFKSNGDVTTDYTIDGESQGAETVYYKIMDANTLWICDDRNTCAEADAQVLDYAVNGLVLTLIDPMYPEQAITLNKVP